jgi:cytochrome c oxidase cbb3-type subunit III
MDERNDRRIQRMVGAKGIEIANAPAMRNLILACAVCVGIALPESGSQAKQRSAADGGSPQLGQQLFSSNCAGCHGLDGHGGEHGPNIATTPEVQRLSERDVLGVVRDGIPAAGMPAFRSKFDNPQLDAVVSYLRVLQGKHAAASVPGNPERGRSLFFGKAHCSECHMVAGKGGFIGPDLTSYGNQHAPDVIRDAIIDPNKNLDPRHRTFTVVTPNGRRYTGIALNEDNFSLQLQTLDGTFHFFDKSKLAHVEHEPRSLMPSNYGSMFSRGELDDLVSYLTTADTRQVPTAGGDEEQ